MFLRMTSLLAVLTLGTIPEGVFTEKPQTLVVLGGSFTNLKQSGQFGPGTAQLYWSRYEKAAAATDWHHSTNTYSVRYRIVGVSARQGGDVLYVAGIASDENSVIEKWEFPSRTGRWQRRQSGTSLPIGTSMPAYTASSSIVGGTYTAPPTTWVAPTITTVLESTAYGHIRSISVDPEGRYLLFTNYPQNAVYQLDLLSTGSVPTMLFDVSQIPQLGALSSVNIQQHRTWGRVCAIEPGNLWKLTAPASAPLLVILKDADNDGVFEAHSTMSQSDYLTAVSLPVPANGATVDISTPWTGD